MKRINLNLIKGILFLAISVLLIILIPNQISIKGETGPVTSRTFPYLVFSLMALCSFALLIRGITEKDGEYIEISYEVFKAAKTPLLVLLILAVYIFLIDKLGYIISSLLATNSLLLLLKCRKWYFYAICSAAVFAIYLLFTNILNVLLPSLL